jgi:hypothetical protein
MIPIVCGGNRAALFSPSATAGQGVAQGRKVHVSLFNAATRKDNVPM